MDTVRFVELIKRGEIPPESPDCASPYGRNYPIGDCEHYHARETCTSCGMWAIVDKRWTKILAKWIGNRQTLEVMAGAGWLARALADHGVAIQATDNYNWDARHDEMKRVFPVEKMDALVSVKSIRADVLIVSWPPYSDSAIVEVCEEWGPGRPIVYIGESRGGCNAPDEFFDCFVDIKHPRIPMLAWPGLHDSVKIGHWRMPQ